MKHRKTDVVLLVLTLMFTAFLAGYFVGRNHSGSELVVETLQADTATSQTQATVPDKTPSQPDPSDGQDRINLNTATVEELMTLPGIGEVRAQAIVDYRTEIGAFVSVDQLQDVSGIGKKTLDKIRDYITVG